ncbi:MAG TPA: carboxymuconolactone decarboxylase family protein [Acidimicrobiales bacterium]|jgi:alkylhydroperoxidase family enzyme|nr:carboxymuconolactone decarboxylase family protein [Acidimicrobiales bacterium]
MSTPPSPRLAPLPFSGWDEETRATLLSHLRRPELYLSGSPDAPPMPIVLELFAHHVPLSETFLSFTDVMASEQSTLEPRIRELAILRVAWRTRSGYEWTQHRRMGGDEGLTEAQLTAVPEGPGSTVWSAPERAVVSAADEMIDHFAVADETWDVLTASFEPASLFELLFVIGGYLCLASVLNSIGLRGDEPETP